MRKILDGKNRKIAYWLMLPFIAMALILVVAFSLKSDELISRIAEVLKLKKEATTVDSGNCQDKSKTSEIAETDICNTENQEADYLFVGCNGFF